MSCQLENCIINGSQRTVKLQVLNSSKGRCVWYMLFCKKTYYFSYLNKPQGFKNFLRLVR